MVLQFCLAVGLDMTQGGPPIIGTPENDRHHQLETGTDLHVARSSKFLRRTQSTI